MGKLPLLHLSFSLFRCLSKKKKKKKKKGKKKTEAKKHPPISELISTRGASICLPSPYEATCTFTFWRHPPSRCRQITKKERGSNWRLKPLISLEKVCTLLGGPEWPFADKTGAEKTGTVDKWDIRIQQQEWESGWRRIQTAGDGYNHCKHDGRLVCVREELLTESLLLLFYYCHYAFAMHDG